MNMNFLKRKFSQEFIQKKTNKTNKQSIKIEEEKNINFLFCTSEVLIIWLRY